MSDGKRKVLEMLQEGKITQEEAARLLDALGESEEAAETAEPQAGNEPEAVPEQPEQAAGPESGESDTTIIINDEGKEKVRIDVDGGNVPKLTLYPDGDDGLADEISRTVEDTIEQAQKELGNDWDAIGERINNAVTNTMNSVFGSAPTPPTPPAPPAPPAPPVKEADSPAELTEPGAPYHWNIGKEELNSLSIDWVSGQVEIVQGGSDQVVVTEYAKRPLKEDERMYITFEDGEMRIRWCEKKKTWGFHRNFITEKSKRLVVELPLNRGNLEEIRVHTASADVSMAQIVACLDEVEVNTASGSVSAKEVRGDDLRIHTASGAIKVVSSQFDDISLKSASGSIWAEGVTADDFDAYSNSGSVHAAGVTADDFQATTVSGPVSIEGVTADDMTASTVNGSLKAKSFTADDVNLKTVSNGLYAFGMADDLHAETISGGLELHLARDADEVDLHTVSGKIQLYLPETASGFTANYSTTSGRFESEFSLAEYRGGKNGCAVYGDGDMEITLSTMSGNMQISKE